MSESDVYPRLGVNEQDRQIRLVELHPSSVQDDIIHCKFHTASLDDKESYETLSYVWGDAKVTKTIFLNDHPFEVTVNLYSALQHLRKDTGTRMLWVDALCINQTDGEEKTHQINMMRDIYRTSRNGLVWLGDFVSLGLDLEKAIAARDLLESFANVLTDENHVAELPCFQEPSKHSKVFQSIMLLMESPWWTRIWTVQEVALPPKSLMIWGSVSISWEIVEKACDSLLPHQLTCCNGVATSEEWEPLNDFMNKIIIIQITRRPDVAPLLKLWRCRLRTATDPRDKVLGLLGLCPTLSLGIPGHSYYNIDAVTLYQVAIADLIQLERKLTPLIGLRGEQPNYTAKASWAIDWTVTREGPYGFAFWTHITRNATYSADRNKSLVIVPRPHEGILQLKGFCADEVIAVGQPLITTDYFLSDAYLLDTVKKWREKSFEFRPPGGKFKRGRGKYFTGEDWEDALFRTLVGNMMTDGVGGGLPTLWVQKKDLKSFKSYIKGDQQSLPFRKSIIDMCRDQTFFITRKGYMGIGSPSLEKGDEIWILWGGRSPFTLRNVQPKDLPDNAEASIPSYITLGDCYVHGIMKGEAMKGNEERAQMIMLQ